MGERSIGDVLAALSEHHQRALGHAWALTAVGANSSVPPDEVVRSFLEFWEREVPAHHRVEEGLLFRVLAQHPDPPEAVSQALAEHERLDVLVRRLRDGLGGGDLDRPSLHRLGRAIQDHIRLEERELYPWLAAVLEGSASVPA